MFKLTSKQIINSDTNRYYSLGHYDNLRDYLNDYNDDDYFTIFDKDFGAPIGMFTNTTKYATASWYILEYVLIYHDFMDEQREPTPIHELAERAYYEAMSMGWSPKCKFNKHFIKAFEKFLNAISVMILDDSWFFIGFYVDNANIGRFAEAVF